MFFSDFCCLGRLAGRNRLMESIALITANRMMYLETPGKPSHDQKMEFHDYHHHFGGTN